VRNNSRKSSEASSTKPKTPSAIPTDPLSMFASGNDFEGTDPLSLMAKGIYFLFIYKHN